MTAESVLTNVLLEIGLDNASAQLTSNDYDIRQIKAFMNAAGKDISRRTEMWLLLLLLLLLFLLLLRSLIGNMHMIGVK